MRNFKAFFWSSLLFFCRKRFRSLISRCHSPCCFWHRRHLIISALTRFRSTHKTCGLFPSCRCIINHMELINIPKTLTVANNRLRWVLGMSLIKSFKLIVFCFYGLLKLAKTLLLLKFKLLNSNNFLLQSQLWDHHFILVLALNIVKILAFLLHSRLSCPFYFYFACHRFLSILTDFFRFLFSFYPSCYVPCAFVLIYSFLFSLFQPLN